MDLSSDGLLECLAIDLERELCKLKRFSPDESTQIAVAVVEKVRVGWAGQSLLCPMERSRSGPRVTKPSLPSSTDATTQSLPRKTAFQ